MIRYQTLAEQTGQLIESGVLRVVNGPPPRWDSMSIAIWRGVNS